ncbi:hypothetical protein PBRA_009183, partial [Plasmodiophora brassicae]
MPPRFKQAGDIRHWHVGVFRQRVRSRHRYDLAGRASTTRTATCRQPPHIALGTRQRSSTPCPFWDQPGPVSDTGGLQTDCVLRWQLAGGGRHLRAAQSGECRKQCLISVSRAQFFQTATASEPGAMCIGRSVASPPTAHLAPYATIGSPASASMQCLHVGGFVLNCDRNLVHVDGADVPTSSLTIEWAFTHDAVDGVVKRSHGDGHVLHLAANGRHGPVAYTTTGRYIWITGTQFMDHGDTNIG